ncbi:MAG: asparagine synthase (glutamine-hydrolyzing) [Proteobacteria bacterium]|nr:asparagine synthase (glutamine-hydrolyzing) [Pseudomonadota bacterium]
MCGIAGFWYFYKKTSHPEKLLRKMAKSIDHRGPDGEGIWYDPTLFIGFAHRRLSIVDLSETGHQPMISKNGRWVLCYNGEIYNTAFLQVLLKTKGGILNGHSDTEIILESISLFGLDFTLHHLNGMFAFSLWDRQTETLYLGKDRLGIKPLYWTHQEDGIWFASELKALLQDNAVRKKTNPEAVDKLIRYGYIPAPLTIYKNIFKLLPGYILTFKKNNPPAFHPYWTLEDTIKENAHHTSLSSEEDLHGLLKEVVKDHLSGDVDIGAFLSGGIDSTLIVALMKEVSSNPIKTFCIGFNENLYNEAPYAKTISNFLGTDHTEHYISSSQVLDVIPKLSDIYDEPLGDSSQIPTYLVSSLSRQQVKVVLSGDGGDELFGGYKRYLLGNKLFRWKNCVPCPSFLINFLNRMPKTVKRIFHSLLPPILKKWGYPESFFKVLELLHSKNYLEIYDILINICPKNILINENPSLWEALSNNLSSRTAIEQFLYFDEKFYLPDDILAKVDRASMAVGLEVRVPFLDPRIVSQAWRIPITEKIQGNSRKKILRSILSKYLPKNLYERPKMGFRAPVDHWLRGPLKDWAHTLLEPKNLSPYFNQTHVMEAWINHLNKKKDNGDFLWPILMYQAWKEKWPTEL